MAIKSKVLELLSTGRKNTKSTREIADLLNVDERTVTQEIHRLRVKGTLICSDCNGYFLPESDRDVQDFCRWMNSRVKAIKQASQPAEKYLIEKGRSVNGGLF